jgi:hypothetical protein
LTFVVTTKSTSGNITSSNEYRYSVPADVPKAAAVQGAAATSATQVTQKKKPKKVQASTNKH